MDELAEKSIFHSLFFGIHRSKEQIQFDAAVETAVISRHDLIIFAEWGGVKRKKEYEGEILKMGRTV